MVSFLVAVKVVVFLEVVYVNQKYGGGFPGPVRKMPLVEYPGLEDMPVVKPGEGVVVGHVLQPLADCGCGFGAGGNPVCEQDKKNQETAYGHKDEGTLRQACEQVCLGYCHELLVTHSTNKPPAHGGDGSIDDVAEAIVPVVGVHAAFSFQHLFLCLEDAQGLCVNLAVSRLYNLTGVVLGCDPAYVAQVADSNVRSLGIDDVCLSCLQETDSADEVIEHVAILFYSEDSDRLAPPPPYV